KQKAAISPYVELEKEGARRGSEAYRKYKSADYMTAKSALLDFQSFLDKISYPPDAPDEFRTDAMITSVRLAKLEEQNHGPDQGKYMRDAVDRCESFTPKTAGCSEEGLRKLVDELD